MAGLGHRITIAAPRADVLEAITSVRGLKGWFSPGVEGRTDPGGELKLDFTEAEGPLHWKVTEAAGDSTVRWECTRGPGRAAGTVVTFALSEKGGGKTVVDLDHEGFEESDEKLRTCNTLWGGLLTHLKKYVETNEARPSLR